MTEAGGRKHSEHKDENGGIACCESFRQRLGRFGSSVGKEEVQADTEGHPAQRR